MSKTELKIVQERALITDEKSTEDILAESAKMDAAIDMIVTYLESSEQSKNIAFKAMKRIKKEGLDPIPEIYQVWYCYYTGNFPELCETLDKLTEIGRGFSNRVIARLYVEFFSDIQHFNAIQKAEKDVQIVLESVVSLLKSAGSESTRYGEIIERVGMLTQKDQGVEQMKAIIDVLTHETKRMISHNSELNEALNSQSLQVKNLRKDLKVKQEEVFTDALTGIANRRKFEMSLTKLIEANEAGKRRPSMMMIDIDHFKNFNDKFGHLVGDQVLRAVASIINKNVENEGLAARYGGEEFCVLLPKNNLASALKLAKKVREAVADKKMVGRNTKRDLGKLTVSIGVTQYRAKEELTSFINRADTALYTAKNAGRDRVVGEP